uniref:Uncharacterized protein n=1 Tax=Anas platyrhynchos platyrhynchos TaxID=8840 RepID=A0A493STV8_ANAPP
CLSSAAPPLEEVDIDVDIENVLLDHFKEPNVVKQILNLYQNNIFSLDIEKHVSKKKGFRIFSKSLDDADVNNMHHITESIIMRVKANIEKKEKDKMDYSRTFIHEILKEVGKGMNSVPNTANYTFNKDYRIDLSLYLCRMAAERFKDMHTAFRKANDPVVYLE